MKMFINGPVVKAYVPIVVTLTLETIEEARTLVAIANAGNLSDRVDWEDAKGPLADNLFSLTDYQTLRDAVMAQGS
jgi:hypothetical protein